MRNKMSRLFAVLLAAIMLLNVLPLSAMATETDPLQTADPLQSSDLLQTADPLQAADTLQSSDPLQAVPDEVETDSSVSDAAVYSSPSGRAAGETIYVLAGGDFQEAGDHVNSAENVTNILAQISQKYTTMDGFLFIGDYDCETHDSATETANGITALMGAVQGRYANIVDANSVLVQGNHDYMDSRIDATGGHEFDGYAAYVLNEDDYPNGGGSQSGMQTLANNLKAWLTEKIGEGYEAPIFIVSHLPLAFTPRTVTQGDAKYARYIFDVLNDAGSNGLNIIFLHGHDHAYGPDNYMGGEAIYLPEGDKICIAETGSTSAWTEETLNFTYMNAGYTGYYSDAYTYVTTAGTEKLTMTVFAINANHVTVERYSANGLYNLKSAGYDGSYSNTSVTNVSLGLPKYDTVYTSPQTIALTAAQDYGATIGEWVGVSAETPDDDVTTSNEGWVELIAPVPETPEVPATPESTQYVYTLDTDGTVTDKANAEQGYLIVGSGNDSAMTASLGATNVTITDNAITLDAQPNYEWWITSDGKITDGTNWLAASIDWRSGSVSVTTNENNAYSWGIEHAGSGAYQITGKYSGMWTTTYYLHYSNNAFSVTSSSNTVRLFSGAEVTTPATEGTPAIPGTNGTYGKIVGELTYEATAGMTAGEAMALVQAGIDGYYYDAMSTPGSDVTGTVVDDSILTWEWVDTFDGNTAGDYEVAIKYNNFLLGTAEVVVPADTTYYIAEGNGLYLVDMNTTAANAMATVKAGVTVYSATDAEGSNKTALSDDDVTWNWVDTYNGADTGPYTVEILKDGTSLGTVEVKVNVKYETGIADGWTYIGESEATGGSYTYTLDTDGIDSNGRYIIVAESQALALHTSGSSASTAVSVTISSDGKTLTTDTRDYEYYWNSTYGFTRGSYGLHQSGYYIYLGEKSASYMDGVINNGDGTYCLYDNEGTKRTLYYNGSRFTVSEEDNYTDVSVRLYKYTGTTGGTPGGPIYAKIEGNTIYTVGQGTSATQAMAKVKAGITGYISANADGSNPTVLDDAALTWKWKNAYTSTLTGSYWVEISYNGVVLGTVEVRVKPATINNYPEYPDEGAVKVNKTATGIDFQSSGIAQVEVSASGVPVKKGVDVIVMLDTSSSMAYCLKCSNTRHNTYVCDQGGQTRAQALEETLGDLIAQFKTPGDDGELLDIDVAIADFNGFYGNNHSESGTPYDRDAEDMMSDDISYTANSEAQVYTNTTGALDATAFVPAEDLKSSYSLNYTSGTNYDYAMDAIYQMATAKQIANGSEERDLFVIFMSDGAAMQWNYYHSQGGSNLWENWITGAWGADALDLNCNTHAYYYDEVDHNGDGMRNEHRMANAIKGNPTEEYEVIRKTNDLGTPTGEDNMYMVPGLGAKMFAIAFDPRVDSNVEAVHMVNSIATLASEQTGTTQYFYNVASADALGSAFTSIGAEIAYAASNARFVDQMGATFNLQMKPASYDVVENGVTTTKTLTPTIEIRSYDIYTREDYLNGTITEDKIGDRKGTFTVLETVTFNADGTQAYSDQIGGGTTNILADGTQEGYVKGVIYAKTFLYNTTLEDVAVNGVNIPAEIKADDTTAGSTNMLPSETFYWKMGTVQTSELAMRYYVYLDGSMEGSRPGGSYATNEFATLYYDNYLGNPVYKDTVSPVMAWKEANVSYAFYLVNEKGEIIVNQATGQTGSFANKIAVTNPVVYDTILLNNLEEVRSIDVAAVEDDVLPKYYELYDYQKNDDGTVTGATYTVTINSNTTGSWEISSVKDVKTTYVTQYNPADPSAYSNAATNGTVGHDYTHTVVWFAVVWSINAHPDAVVVDYGLPVDISVLTNDMFGTFGNLAGIGPYSAGLEDIRGGEAMQSGFGTVYTGTYGIATADLTSGKVRYTLQNMEMNGYEKFAYAVNYIGNENAGYYYDTITVIPATTIYYEDDFLRYSATGTTWETAGTYDSTKTQDEDRPGKYSLTDANNIYGFDHINKGMSTYSLGSAKKVHVVGDAYATAEFTFYGTGFDVIGMTSNTTGVLAVKVEAAEDIVSNGATVYTAGQKVCATAVDTYYGYTSVEHVIEYVYKEDTDGGKWEVSRDLGLPANYTGTIGTEPERPNPGDTYIGLDQVWVVTPDIASALYQIPVIQIEDLPYGKYTVLLTATYHELLDHTSTENTDETPDGYDLYLDAIRIYDPANDGAVDGSEDTTIEDAYRIDGEGWPSYLELRNNVISVGSFDNTSTSTKIEGLVFIDGDASVGSAQMADYTSYGPNNELYLASGQQVAFTLDLPENIAAVHLGMKSANGQTCTYEIKNIAKVKDSEADVDEGEQYNIKHYAIDTTTDMYYDVTSWDHDIIVIENVGPGILSLTNIKFTYKSNPDATGSSSNPAGANSRGTLSMTPYSTKLTLKTLNAAAVIPDVEEPVVEGPVIVTQPVSYEGNVGDKVDFTVVAEGEGLSYQWYYKAAGSEDWLKSYSTGSTTATLSVELRAYRDGQEYRCMVTDANGETVVSDAASMTLNACDIAITAQPADYEGAVGDMATFTVEVAGDNLSYRWQYSNDGGKTWQNSWSDGYSTETLTVEMRAYRIGQLYRCVISNTAGEEVISDAATLALKTSVIEILVQPENVTCTAGETVKFTVHAAGEGLKYRWYRSADGETWTMTWLTGYNTAELSFLANASRAGYAYKCVITDADDNTLETNAVSCVLN